MADIAALLTQSRAAHEQYKLYLPRMIPTGVGSVTASSGNPPEAKKFVADAKRLREEAHAADPLHLDPAWALEPVPHAELMAFYALVVT